MTEPIQHHLDYRSAPFTPRPRLICRALTTLSLAPITLAKSWIVFNRARDFADLGKLDRGTAIFDIVILVILSVTIASDLHLIWAFTYGWRRRIRWIWPASIFPSLLTNIILPTCLGFGLSMQFEPLAHTIALALACELSLGMGIASAILMVMTCIITDKDRRHQPQRAVR